MKKTMNMLTKLLAICCVFLTIGCNDWLTQTDETAMSGTQVYSTVGGISSVAANLYSRLRYEQDFSTDAGAYDLCSWDEATNSSAYWAFATNKGQGYRSYYDYTLIRNINQHIASLKEGVGVSVTENNRKYFLAEARYMRAYVYFTLVSRLGGVPIIEDVAEYTNTPLDLAKPRNKESEVYDYIVNELDSIKDDLGLAASGMKTRATKGAALALKCRAMLYAGTIAYNYDLRNSKGLILPSGATGIDKGKTNEYLVKCLDAYNELQTMGAYSLYEKNTNLATNFSKLFTDKVSNPEIIFCKDYDGNKFTNDFTMWTISRSMKSALKTGAQISPVLNLADCYEVTATHTVEPINPYTDGTHIEEMGTTTSTYNYRIFDNREDLLNGRDPRLSGTIIYPGSSFRNIQLDFQAGLAVKTNSGYLFKTVQDMDNTADLTLNYYQGEKITGEEGPHMQNDYISHSGFLLRKYVDIESGSEGVGASSVPYIVFRYGEVLLNAAEAAFYLDQNGYTTYQGSSTRNLALNCINKIRKRAGGEAFKITDAELTLDRIINERRTELAFEDHRYNDLKRWTIADVQWNYDVNNENAVMYGLWPYKIYAPGDASNGKWLYRKVRLLHRGSTSNMGMPINFDKSMYYSTYPMDEGNPFIEKNPNQ